MAKSKDYCVSVLCSGVAFSRFGSRIRFHENQSFYSKKKTYQFALAGLKFPFFAGVRGGLFYQLKTSFYKSLYQFYFLIGFTVI
jgi:hypothetical protein